MDTSLGCGINPPLARNRIPWTE